MDPARAEELCEQALSSNACATLFSVTAQHCGHKPDPAVLKRALRNISFTARICSQAEEQRGFKLPKHAAKA